MKTNRIFVCYLFSLFFSILLIQQSFSKEYSFAEIERVENKAVSNRERFKSWHIRISHSEIRSDPSFNYDPDNGDSRGKFVGMELFKPEDKDFFREDRSYHLEGKDSEYTTVLGEEWLFYLGPETVRQEGSTKDIPLLMMTNRKKKDTDFPRPYDIRTLGFVPQNIRSIPFELREFIGSLERKDISMEDAELNGEQCYRINFSLLDSFEGNKTSVWITPSRDYNPLKFEMVFPKEKQVSTFDITVEKQKGYWFPSVIHTVVKLENNIVSENKTLIEVVSLNEKLDSNLFNEKGLNLPVGTLVLMDPEPAPGTYTWDGEKIVGLNGATLAPVPVRNYTIRYLLVAVGLALICASCLMKYFELRRKKREQSGD